MCTVSQSCPTLWTVACQPSLSMEFYRQEYWSRLPGDPPDPGFEPVSLVSPALADRFFTISTTCEAHSKVYII